MSKSSSLSVWIEGFAALEHGPDHCDAAAREGDERLGMVFPLASLSVVEGLGEWVARRDSAISALVENAFERLVAAEGPAPSCALSGLALDGCEAGGGGERIGRAEASDVADAGDAASTAPIRGSERMRAASG